MSIVTAVRCRSRDLLVVAASGGAVAAGARASRDDAIGDAESRIFARVNSVTDRVVVPVWAVMQVGSLGGSLAIGAAVAASGHPRLGRRMAVVSAVTWMASKAVKPLVGRGRPVTVVDSARVLGRASTGLGYPSGHAAIAVAMASAASPFVSRRLRPALWSVALGVGVSRIYVGAHMPLDVAGGVALGVGTERAVRLLTGPAA
ncbi:MAG TPA: phosphatase PAP2 family protein [Ilumatobacteraceae bacterium]|nr:phosphatase PAP2 family protein [Ilumatobacteraceae bacterium]